MLDIRKNILDLNHSLPNRIARHLDFGEHSSSVIERLDPLLTRQQRSPSDLDFQIVGPVEARDERESMYERTAQVVQ